MKRNWTNRRKLLTKDELKHLTKIAGCFTKAAFQRTIDEHEKWRMAFPCNLDPCWDCRRIAINLNMKGDPDAAN